MSRTRRKHCARLPRKGRDDDGPHRQPPLAVDDLRRIDGASRLSWRATGAASPTLTGAIEVASAPFAQPGVRAAASSAGTLLASVVPAALVAVWAAGFGVTLLT